MTGTVGIGHRKKRPGLRQCIHVPDERIQRELQADRRTQTDIKYSPVNPDLAGYLKLAAQPQWRRIRLVPT